MPQKKNVKKSMTKAAERPKALPSSNRLSLIDTDHITPTAMNQGNLSHKLKIEMLKRKLKSRG